jgi:hypothetical protein
MNSIFDLKEAFVSNKIKIKEHLGYLLTCKNGDEWTLILGQYYKNNVPMSKKQINEYIKRKGK